MIFHLVISPMNPSYGEPVRVTIDITNTGQRTGDEVAQLYLSHTQSAVEMPVKQLRGFKRITLDPGEKKTVTFTITNDELYYYNEADSSFTVEPGIYSVMAGGSSDSLSLRGSFQMQSGLKNPDLVITGIRTLPRYPLKGEMVQFLATVKNQGTGATGNGAKIKVLFKIDGKEVSWSANNSASVPAGGMALIGAGGVPEGLFSWKAMNAGTFTLEARADYDNTLDECVENNNLFTTDLTVYPESPVNLAPGKPVNGCQKHFNCRIISNYPNPFNPTTTITYEVTESSVVRIDIINFLGRIVSTLINSEHTPGIYSVRWNGLDNSGQKAASGIYFFRMQSGNFSESRKMLLMK
ncbi:MAG: fibronectin type III-like domain-contianing protein [Acidobacteriota bacterium]